MQHKGISKDCGLKLRAKRRSAYAGMIRVRVRVGAVGALKLEVAAMEDMRCLNVPLYRVEIWARYSDAAVSAISLIRSPLNRATYCGCPMYQGTISAPTYGKCVQRCRRVESVCLEHTSYMAWCHGAYAHIMCVCLEFACLPFLGLCYVS